MTAFRTTLMLCTVFIYGSTIVAIVTSGWNWPAVYFSDLVAGNWRSQFNADFLIYLVLASTWMAWREGFTPRGWLFGGLNIGMGGMFGFAYLAWQVQASDGDPQRLLMGVHAPAGASE